MDAQTTFLFAGGGTGGHLFPGIAVAEELRRALPDARLIFAGSQRTVEREILGAAGLEHVPLDSPPSTLLRRHPLRFVLQYRRACRDAVALISARRPAAVIGLGGFASVPVVTAAKKRRVPIVLLEQNAVAGRATARLSRLADVVCHSFAEAVPRSRRQSEIRSPVRPFTTHPSLLTTHHDHIVTGNPVRRAVAELAAGKAACSGRTLLVLGGSQGSTAVNDALLEAAEMLRETLHRWRIVHQTGPRDVERVRAAYARLGLRHDVQPFFADLPARYATADLAVSRAGATTLAELACASLPAVLIPYPRSVRNHQQRNAEAFARAGAAVIVEQRNATSLVSALQPLLEDDDLRRRLSSAMRSLARPDAAARVAAVVLHVAGFAPRQRCERLPASPHFETPGERKAV